MGQGRFIAWTGLEPGTPVVASDGEQIGKVGEVVGDRESDIFSGLVITAGLLTADRFVPADQVGDLSPDEVRLRLSSSEADSLEVHEP